VPRSAEETKQRIFDAATAEFTTHGIAGARVDRIAAAAAANKQLIYAYFGNKRQLFEAVVAEHVARVVHEVPFDAYDIPGWAGRSFDFYAAHPEVPQLATWHALEPGESQHRVPALEEGIARAAKGIEQAQREGIVTSALEPADLLAITNAIVRAWVVGPPERDPQPRLDAAGLARRRAAVVEATRRLIEPR
jgi:AcrR family transcriptional regulator